MNSIRRVIETLTDVPADEIMESIRTPQLSLFLFQFMDYLGVKRTPRPKEKVL